MKNEYKPERANVPTRHTLEKLKWAYIKLNEGDKKNAITNTLIALAYAIDQREVDDIQSIPDFDKPKEAMARIAEILTCGGRIYDEYSDFLKPKVREYATYQLKKISGLFDQVNAQQIAKQEFNAMRKGKI